jgi:hypothetical protein
MVAVQAVEDFEQAFSTMSREQVGGFVVVAAHRLPARSERPRHL